MINNMIISVKGEEDGEEDVLKGVEIAPGYSIWAMGDSASMPEIAVDLSRFLC